MKGSRRFMAESELSEVLWSCAIEATVCQRQHFVINTLFSMQPVKSSQDKFDTSFFFFFLSFINCGVLNKLNTVLFLSCDTS